MSTSCPQCGKPIRPGAKFCNSCGANLGAVLPPVAPPPSPSAEASPPLPPPSQAGAVSPPMPGSEAASLASCPNCGRPARAGVHFCTGCGQELAPLAGVSPATPPPPAVTPPPGAWPAQPAAPTAGADIPAPPDRTGQATTGKPQRKSWVLWLVTGIAALFLVAAAVMVLWKDPFEWFAGSTSKETETEQAQVSTPVASNTAAPTPGPTATHTLTPPSTLTPTPASSNLTGHLVWKNSGDAIIGADIFLCKVTGESCQIDPALKATTQAEGYFEFLSLSPGSYVILYNPDGGTNPPGGTLDLSKESIDCAVQGLMGGIPAKCQGKTPIFGEGSLTLAKGSSMGISADGGFSLSDGSLFSEKYNLNMDFENGKPISVEIIGGKDQDIVVKAWEG